jgi:hypothetical protein
MATATALAHDDSLDHQTAARLGDIGPIYTGCRSDLVVI